MSADNGIYIAHFPDGIRVIHAQAIGNLNYFPAGTWAYEQEIANYFQDAKFFTDEDEAVKFAFEHAKEIQKDGPLEYGISDLGPLPKTW
jgi:hypothetical protein